MNHTRRDSDGCRDDLMATAQYDMICYDIFVNCNWVATRWQKYCTHLHTKSKQNDTKQTIHRTTQQFWKTVGRARLG
jgi:SPX domain protein involved in polyphosphate accumulation